MVCGEREEDDEDIEDWVACVHSGYILSAYPPIIHTLYHMQTFIAIFVYSSNFFLILTVMLRGGVRAKRHNDANCWKFDLLKPPNDIRNPNGDIPLSMILL